MATVLLLNLFCWCNQLAVLIRGEFINLLVKNLDTAVANYSYFSLENNGCFKLICKI